MKADVVCPVCQDVVGKVHGNKTQEVLSLHMLENHPAEYNEIAEVKNRVDEIWKKYHVHSTEFSYYRTRRLWNFYARNFKG